MYHGNNRTNKMGKNPRRGRGFASGGRGRKRPKRARVGFSGRGSNFGGRSSSVGHTGYRGPWARSFSYQFGIKVPSNQQPYTVVHPGQGGLGQIATDKLRLNTHNPVQGSPYNRGF